MDSFPQSWPLAGRSVVLVGDGVLAARKRALLDRTTAEVRALPADAPMDAYRGAAFAIVALEGRGEAEVAAARARAAGLPVNVVDQPDLSDFHVPAIVDRGEIVIAVASGGVAPTLARDVRAAIEAAVPPSVAALAALARRIKDVVRTLAPDVSVRRAAWERILRGPAADRARAGDIPEAERLALAELEAPAPRGVVHLVGAGPGDPELLTLKALRLLQDADVIVHDRLVDPRILDMARRDADRIFVGKARAVHAVPQEEIHTLLIALAQAGKRVVRLKGGDPFVFGRGGEELDALRTAGVEAHVVPGITAALGCAAAAGAALTHRDYAQAVTFVTGHAREGCEAEPDLDWRALAAANHIVVIYMGGARAGALARRLMEAGRDAATPTLVVENGTRPDERRLLTRLDRLAADLAAFGPRGPTLLILGEAAARADAATLVAQAWARAA